MRNIILVITVIAGIFLFMTREATVQNTYTDTMETPKKTELDTPANTYRKQVEALNISNSMQHPANNYLNGRIDAVERSRKSLSEANKRREEENRAMEALIK